MIKVIKYDFNQIAPNKLWVKTYMSDGTIHRTIDESREDGMVMTWFASHDYPTQWSAWVDENGEWVNNREDAE